MRSLVTALSCLSLSAAACAMAAPSVVAASPQATASTGGSLFITGVSIIDPAAGSTSAPQDIWIEAGRITAIASAGTLRPPTSTPRVDGAGRFAMAGLIDVHAHLGEGGLGPGDDAGRARALRQFLRYGVTSIFAPGGAGANDADFAALRERCRSEAAACPALYGSGSLITAPGSHPMSTIFNMAVDPPAPAMEAVGVTILAPDADIPALIAAKQAAGVDAIKIIIEDGPPPWRPRPRLTDDQIRAITAAAHARALPVFAHVGSAEHVRIALDAGVDGIMHSPVDRLPDDLVQRMADQGMVFVATFALYDGLLTWARRERESDPYALAGVEPSAIESLTAPPFLEAAPEDEAGVLAYLANTSDNIRRAAAAGAPIALGTDVNNPFVFPGYSAHEELALMVHAGLTPAQALYAGTQGSAAFLRRSDQVGRLAPGYEADLLLLARNPLTQIENSRSIVAVISDGQSVANVVSSPASRID